MRAKAQEQNSTKNANLVEAKIEENSLILQSNKKSYKHAYYLLNYLALIEQEQQKQQEQQPKDKPSLFIYIYRYTLAIAWQFPRNER